MSEYTFEPFQKVLVRISGEWCAAFFSHQDAAGCYITTSHHIFPSDRILPYNDETKHLLGTLDDFKPKWKPKPGDLVAVRDIVGENWKVRTFSHMGHEAFYCFLEQGLETVPWRYCEPLRKHFNVTDE